MKEEVKKEAVKEEKKVAPKKEAAKAPKAEAPQEEVKRVDPYVAAVNAIVNNEEFRKAIIDLLNVKTVLSTKLSQDAANACVNIINSNNTRIAKVVTNVIFDL